MCDAAKFAELEERVDGHDARLAAIEEKMAAVGDSCARIEKAIDRVYGERAKWGEWFRSQVSLKAIGSAAMRWGVIIFFTLFFGTRGLEIIRTVIWKQ